MSFGAKYGARLGKPVRSIDSGVLGALYVCMQCSVQFVPRNVGKWKIWTSQSFANRLRLVCLPPVLFFILLVLIISEYECGLIKELSRYIREVRSSNPGKGFLTSIFFKNLNTANTDFVSYFKTRAGSFSLSFPCVINDVIFDHLQCRYHVLIYLNRILSGL